MKHSLVYLDNAATSFPKPESVYKAVEHTLREVGGNPGRSEHRMSISAGRILFEARENISRLLNIKDSSRLIFTSSATESLNLAIKGIVKPGDHVITSNIEHSSVIRPLQALEQKGVDVTKINFGEDGEFDLLGLKKTIRKNTSLVVLIHASNVIGTIAPVSDIGSFCRSEGIPLLLDASQTVGSIPVDVEALNVDFLAAPGHKALLGPQGTGLLYIAPGIAPAPLKEGGTGGGSIDAQPLELPDRFEAGTENTPGIAGLGAGVEYILKTGLDRIREKEEILTGRLLDGMSTIKGITFYGTEDPGKRASLVSFNMEGIAPDVISLMLDEEYDIMTRNGLHCAPDAHRFLGTFPKGCIRLSPGYFNTIEEMDFTINALREISERGSG